MAWLGGGSGGLGAVFGPWRLHPDGELIHGWAPGRDDLLLNEEVGIAPPATGRTLELHYNSTDPEATDRSGIEICVTPNEPRKRGGHLVARHRPDPGRDRGYRHLRPGQ